MLLLLNTQASPGICLWCVFILMLGSFLIGFFGKDIKLPTTLIPKEEEKEKKEERIRLKPLGVIKTIDRSGNDVNSEKKE